MQWWEQTGIDWKGDREKEEAAEEATEPALTDTDLESEADADTTDGTAEAWGRRRPWVPAAPVERGGGLNPSGRDLKRVQT